jgi:hypothetical protein
LPRLIKLDQQTLEILSIYTPKLKTLHCCIELNVDISVFLLWQSLETLHLQLNRVIFSTAACPDMLPLREHHSLRALSIFPWPGNMLEPRYNQSEALMEAFVQQIQRVTPPGVGLNLVCGLLESTTVLGHFIASSGFSKEFAERLVSLGASPSHPSLGKTLRSAAALSFILEQNKDNHDFVLNWSGMLQSAFATCKIDFAKQILKLSPERLPPPQRCRFKDLAGQVAKVPEFFGGLLSYHEEPGAVWTAEDVNLFFVPLLNDAIKARGNEAILTALIESIPLDRQDIIEMLPVVLAERQPSSRVRSVLRQVLARFYDSKPLKSKFANLIVSKHAKSHLYDSPLPLFSLFAICGLPNLAKDLVSFVDKKVFRSNFILHRAVPVDSDSASDSDQEDFDSALSSGSDSDSDDRNPLLEDEYEENDPEEIDNSPPVDTVLTVVIQSGDHALLKLLLSSGLCRLDELNAGHPPPLACALQVELPDLILLLQAGCDIHADLMLWALREVGDNAILLLFQALETCYHSTTPIEMFQGISIFQRLCERPNPTRLIKALCKLLFIIDPPVDVLSEIVNEQRTKPRQSETAIEVLVRRLLAPNTIIDSAIELIRLGATMTNDVVDELRRVSTLPGCQNSAVLSSLL